MTTVEELIVGSHRAVAKVSPFGEPENALPVISGSVTLNGQVATRAQCDLTFGSPELVPTSPEDILAPFGQELQAWRGVQHPDGTEELDSLGVFRIESTSVQDTAEGGTDITVDGPDRSGIIIDAAFEEPYQIAAGTDYLTALLAVVQDGYPGVLEYMFPDVTYSTPTLTAQEGEDRWAFAQDMAIAIGMDLYFDRNGVLMLRPLSLIIPAGITLVEGEGGVLLSAGKSWSRTEAANRWIVTGESSNETPVRGDARDENPNSPTFYDAVGVGAFGKKPRFESYEYIIDSAQAQTAAEGLLAKNLGISQSIDFGSVVYPALDPGQTVRITRARLGVDEDHIIDSLTIPLGADSPMTGTTRLTQVI